jgi:cellulose synthase/poly-beta-1,6-N-acetylglucosamine synthase-like glycosyltransferase
MNGTEIFIVIFAVSLLLYGILLIYLSRKNEDEANRQQNWNFTGEPPSVSVLIACRNEEKNLPSLLSQLDQQNYPSEKTEFILLNDHSEDGTFQILENWKRAHPERSIQILSLPEALSGKKAALALGQSVCRSEFQLYTDADCGLPSHWISDMVIAQQNSGADLICGSVVMEPVSIFQAAEALDFSALIATAAGSLTFGRPSLCNAANYMVSSQALNEANQQRKDQQIASGDDVFLLHALHSSGKKIAFCRLPEAEVITANQEGFSAFIQQRIRWAGKSKSGLSGSNSALAVLVWLFHLLFLTGLVALILTKHWNYLLVILAWKTISETLFLEPFQKKKGYRENSGKVWLMQIPYSLYVLIFGVIILFSSGYRWKGRHHSLR